MDTALPEKSLTQWQKISADYNQRKLLRHVPSSQLLLQEVILMGKIVKYLRPYWKQVLLIILLLIVQVYCDLALPQYTSNIIDVGLQSQGVEHILPDQLTEEDYQSGMLFMTSEEKETFAGLYEEDGDLYTRADLTEEELDTYDEELIVPIVMTYQVQSMMDSAEEGDTSSFTMSEDLSAELGDVDTAQLMQMLLSGQMPDEMILSLRETVQSQLDAIGSSTLMSMGKAYAAQCDENAGIDMEDKQMSYMWRTGGMMMLFAAVMMICAISISFIASRTGAAVGRDLRQKTFSNVVNFTNTEMDQFSTASLITRSTNDIQQIQQVTVLILRMVLMAPIMGIGGVIKVAQTGSGMEWVIAVAVAVLIGFVALLGSIAMPKFRIMQTLVDKLNLVSREILTGLPVIRAFRREKREEERFDEANKELTRTQLFTNRVMTMMMPGMMMIMYCITLGIVWVAAGRIDNGYMQVGQMTAFITYTMMIVMAFLMLTVMSIMLPRAGVAAKRIDEVITTQPSIKDTDRPVKDTDNQGVLVFDHVNFRYPGAEADVLSDISFTAKPGTTTAIIGSTGCGKSTLVNLIPRFYDVTGGSITLDGHNIKDYAVEDLRNRIGFVPQKGVLFSGTIASNFRYGKEDASEDEMREAAEVAQALDFIEEKDKGFDSSISQGGSNVSGGQKQRLAIARAIIKKPLLYVFDDSFSALDMKTDAKLRAALSSRTENATVLIVAQRISTILHADQILVLEDGKIVGQGTHEELLRNCDVYEQIAKSQLSEKELGLEG